MAAKHKDWEFKDAQELVKAMRTKTNQLGYDIAIGGSVLTAGASKNDLDLFFVPKFDQRNPVELLVWLASKFGAGKTIISAKGEDVLSKAPPAFAHKMRFDVSGRKIDVFVV